MSLTYPVFMSLFELIRKARYDQAIDQFFTPYAAVKCPKTASRLFSERGDFTIDNAAPEQSAKASLEAVAKARRKLQRIIKARKQAAERSLLEKSSDV